jgi:UDP-N-acetylglucosamine 3-dehydrogenase
MNIGLVGLGGMGTVHFMNYRHVPDAKVTGVVGSTEADRARAKEWGIPLYPTVTALCKAVPVDLVDICAPTFLHHDLVLESLALGRHTVTEKPIALTLADAKEMFAAADAAGRQLYVAQVLQFTREVETLRTAVRDGRYGKPLDACFERLSACPKWTQGSWLFERSKSGLLPFDLHIHDLDVIVSLFGKPKTVAYTSCGGTDKPYREHYRFQYGYDTLNVCAEAAWFNAAVPFTARWRVYFERGMLISDESGVRGYGADGETVVFDVEDPVKIPTGINLPPTGWFLRELTHFTERARENRPSELVPREQVLAVLETLEAIGA